VPDVDEVATGRPEEAVLQNARSKARAVLERVDVLSTVIAADTEVVLDGRVLGKASDEAAARERLRALSGRAHTVLTGLVVLAAQAGGVVAERSGVARSEVTFRDLPRGLLDMYLASGEWRDRAGAYAVQGLGSMLVERLEGDLSNVIGLPVGLLLELAPELLDPAGDSRS
jgi:septum formation protein